jgi:sensor histidine kinase YesM
MNQERITTPTRALKEILKVNLSLVFVFLAIATSSFSATRDLDSLPCYHFSGDKHFSVPYSFFSFFKKGSEAVSIKSLKDNPGSFSFTPFTSPVPLIGFSRQNTWVKVKAENPGNEPIRAYLRFADAGIEDISFYHIRPDTAISCTTGTLRPFHRRDVDDRDFIFHCYFSPHSSSTIYLRCRSTSSLELPVSIIDEESFLKKQRTDHLVSGFVYGILLFFGIAALYLTLIYRDANFRNFAIFMLHYCAMLAIGDGILYMYVWPEFPSMQNTAHNYFFVGSLIWGILFAIHFLKADQYHRRVTMVGYFMVALWAVALFFSLGIFPRFAERLLNILALLTIFYVLFIALLTFRHHDWASRLCFFTWYGFLFLVIARIVIFSFALPAAPVLIGILHSGYHYHIAMLVVAIQMSISISYRLRMIEKDRNAALLETAALQRKTLELKLSTLQARVQPHFLFNTLNTIANLIVVDAPGAERALIELSEFYRMTLRYASRNITRLHEEIDLVKRYLVLEKMKFGKRLSFSFDVDDRSRDVLLPSMSLQILVENSLKHGIHPKIDGGSIHVTTSMTGEKCKIEVNDTGIGIRKKKSDSGTGLANLRSRLDLVYHGNYTLEIIDKQSSTQAMETGVVATIEIPIQPLMANIPDTI